MLRYLRKVQRILREFLADMPNDLPYTLCWLAYFSLSKPSASIRPGIVCVRKRETIPSLLLCDWAEKNKGFLSPSPSCPKGLFFAFLTFLRPNFLLTRLDVFPPPQINCPWVLPPHSHKYWVGVCRPLPKTLTLFMTKICDIPYPIYDLTFKSKPCFNKFSSSEQC